VIDYCANEDIANFLYFITEKDTVKPSYFETYSKYRENTYYGYKNRGKFIEVRNVPNDPQARILPRVIIPNATIHRSHEVDYRTHRARTNPNPPELLHGPAMFNLYGYLQ